MDANEQSQNEKIREIEDVIDIQKASGKFSMKQVVFKLPSESDGTIPADLARSLESGLCGSKTLYKKKLKKHKSKRNKNPLPDVLSWPSDSDITVLRMKLCLTEMEMKGKVGDVVLGDGIHQPSSSSMVNLATLMIQSQTPSKHSLNVEEFLLPLSSWEVANDQERGIKEPNLEAIQSRPHPSQIDEDLKQCEATCSHHDVYENLSVKSDTVSKMNAKSKVARFLRLYFCPCCTCLYNIERMRDETSCYTSKNSQKFRETIEIQNQHKLVK